MIRVKGLDFVLDVKANKYVGTAPHSAMGKIADDADSIPSIDQFKTHDQLESFCHSLLTDIACKGQYSGRKSQKLTVASFSRYLVHKSREFHLSTAVKLIIEHINLLSKFYV